MNLSFGGDNEYVAMAQRAAESGPTKIIQGIFQALGLSKPVANAPKTEDLADGQTPEGKATKQTENLAKAQGASEEPINLPAIAEAETALGVKPLPLTTSAAGPSKLAGAMDFSDQPVTYQGQKWLDSLKPLTTIDPDVGMLGLKR